MTDEKIDSDWLPLLVTGSAFAGFTASYKYASGLDGVSYLYAGISAALASASIIVAAQYEEW